MNTRPMKEITAISSGEDVVINLSISLVAMPIEDADELAAELLTALLDARKERGNVTPPDVLMGAIAEFVDLLSEDAAEAPIPSYAQYVGDTLPTMQRALDIIHGADNGSH